VFPGLLFLVGYALFVEYVDRKLTARMQNRVGPPFLQPFADLIKILAKEDITPEGADARALEIVPLLAFAAIATGFLYVPVLGPSPFSFQGDLIVVLYLLTLPTILLFLLGWLTRNVFGTIGGTRSATQLFLYEVPFFLALLGPGLAAGTWSIAEIVAWQQAHLWFVLTQPIGFVVGLLGLQAKLERVPFDIPEAETEVVAGAWTDLAGRKLAVMRLSIDMAMVVGSALLAALFLGGPSLPFSVGPSWLAPVLGVLLFLGRTLGIVVVLSILRAAMGRFRIDQLEKFAWKYLAGFAVVQTSLILLLRGVNLA
jgi:NADH-quinone oxidoreductase subunit H